MTTDSVEILLHLIHWTGILSSMYLSSSRMRAVRGSYERYKATSLLIIARSLVVISCTGFSVVYALEGRYFFSSWFAMLAVLWFFLAKSSFDDDNWFKKQFNRLKNGFKKLRSIRIHIRMPVFENPLPAPTPVLAN